MSKKELFEKINLKEQLTYRLKSVWYYQDYKDRIKINKHSVVFDDDFKFKLEFADETIAEKTEDKVMKNDIVYDGELLAKKGDIIHIEKGEVIGDAFIMVRKLINGEDNGILGYYGWDKYDNDVNDILKDICLYIANRI